MLMKRLCVYLIILFLLSCNSQDRREERSGSLFSLLDNRQTGLDFTNELTDKEDANIFLHRNFYNGGGVAIGDINNDGWNDVFLTSSQGDNKLYLNKGKVNGVATWQFEDITEKAGVKGAKYWSNGVTMADVNADGWLDIYVCNGGDAKGQHNGNELFINQHDGTFKESAAAYNLVDGGLSTHTVFFDYDLDGDLDCYVLNNSFKPIESFDFSKNLRDNIDNLGGDRLYRNDRMHFTNVTQEAGIYSSDIGFGLGVSVVDINQDGYPDLYVSNDFFEKDYLYINQRNGKFKEEIESALGHISLSSMGADIGDINNDGNYDIFTTEMLPEDDKRYKLITSFESYDLFKIKQKEGYHNQYMQNCLQVNNGDGSFSELAFYAGIAATDWSWGALLFDMDNDGWKDIFVCNGIFKDLTNQDYIDFLSTEDNLRKISEAKKFDPKEFIDKMSSTPVSNYAFSNNRNLTFSNKAAEFGLDRPSFSNGAAYGDLDNDGDNDLVVNNVNMPLFVYRNNAEKLDNHFIDIRLAGDSLNRFAIGSTLHLFIGNTSLVHYHQPDHGFQSSIPPSGITIGIGKQTRIDSVQVIWPDGRYATYKDLAMDTTYQFSYAEGNRKYNFNYPASLHLLEDVSARIFDSIPSHTENEVTDYNRERLMLQTPSTANPYLAAGDINNDRLTDFYYGNAGGTTAKIYMQSTDGTFRQYIPVDFEKQSSTENAGAAFADFDKDGDQDLVVTHGGNQWDQGSESLFPGFFENNGKGELKLNGDKQIKVAVNASVVAVNDFDKDGDPDIFIGGRSVPGNYGSFPPSYLLQNDGTGHFTDISSTIFGNNAPGMVTDAAWADLDKNGFDDLVIAGQWMGIQIYKNANGRFTKDAVLEKYKGWWNCVKIADIDGDGNPDIMGGNLGLNSKFKASFLEPLLIYIKDFDDNGTKESILACFKTDHKKYVFHQRRDLADQMPSFKKKFLKYSDYAGVEFADIFPESAIRGAEVHEINTLESTVFMNRGSMQFEALPLPYPAQISLVNTILCHDIDHDGRNELILAGNFTDFKPELGTLDASYGQVFKFNHNKFEYLPPRQTGLHLTGQVRSSLAIANKNGKTYLLFGRNNAGMMVYQVK
jgi:enediyne biosynthesis protein E4